MARIPDHVIARLKREVSIERLVEASGVKLERHGKDLIGRCPFHDDREPSLVVSPGKNLWHCLGACGEGGSVIDWVMKHRGVGFREAVELLGGDAGVRLGEDGRGGDASGADGASEAPNIDRGIDRGIDPGADREELLRQVVTFYHRTLLATPSALGYLKRRAIGSGEALERFRLGYADRRAGLGLPHRGTKEGVEVRDRLKELGILHPKTGQELFGGSITIPIFDASGSKVVGLYGRKVRDDVNPPYPPVPGRPAPRPLEPGRAPRAPGGHPLRVADRRPDLLVRGLPKRHRRLRHQRLHRRPPRELRRLRHPPGADRLRPGPGRRRGGGEARGRAGEGRRRVLPGAVSQGDGRQRLRALGPAGRQGPGARHPPRGVARDGAGAYRDADRRQDGR